MKCDSYVASLIERETDRHKHTAHNVIKAERLTELPTDTDGGSQTIRQSDNISIVTSTECVNETNQPIRTITSGSGT